MKLLIVINMESFIFLNRRAILNLWTMFIAGLAIVLLKPKIVINFKKSATIFVSCTIYILLIIFACYVIDNILI